MLESVSHICRRKIKKHTIIQKNLLPSTPAAALTGLSGGADALSPVTMAVHTATDCFFEYDSGP